MTMNGEITTTNFEVNVTINGEIITTPNAGAIVTTDGEFDHN